MATVHTPVEGFTGQVVGVNFADGVGECEDSMQLAYFRRHGYTIDGSEPEPEAEVAPEPEPEAEEKPKKAAK